MTTMMNESENVLKSIFPYGNFPPLHRVKLFQFFFIGQLLQFCFSSSQLLYTGVKVLSAPLHYSTGLSSNGVWSLIIDQPKLLLECKNSHFHPHNIRSNSNQKKADSNVSKISTNVFYLVSKVRSKDFQSFTPSQSSEHQKGHLKLWFRDSLIEWLTRQDFLQKLLEAYIHAHFTPSNLIEII